LKIAFDLETAESIHIYLFKVAISINVGNEMNKPVNCGATVPRVNLENLRADNTIGLYSSRIGSADVLISSEAAYPKIKTIKVELQITRARGQKKTDKEKDKVRYLLH